MSPSVAHRQFRQKIQQMRFLWEILQTDLIHQYIPARACNRGTASWADRPLRWLAVGLTEGLRGHCRACWTRNPICPCNGFPPWLFSAASEKSSEQCVPDTVRYRAGRHS